MTVPQRATAAVCASNFPKLAEHASGTNFGSCAAANEPASTVDKTALTINPKNIGIILGSLIGFAVITLFVNMLAAVVFMVFFSTLAGTSYSWKRNVKISIGLCIMAFVFAKFLGMNLPLY